jgi:hypothetical protein
LEARIVGKKAGSSVLSGGFATVKDFLNSFYSSTEQPCVDKRLCISSAFAGRSDGCDIERVNVCPFGFVPCDKSTGESVVLDVMGKDTELDAISIYSDEEPVGMNTEERPKRIIEPLNFG